jgi:hypothetical protein
VQLGDTKVWGVETVDQWGRRVVEYNTKAPMPDVSDLLCDIGDMKDEITQHIVNLTETLGVLRRLRVGALDGDAEAIANATEIVENRSFIDEDHVWAVGSDAAALEELIEEKLESRATQVTADEIDAKVAEIVLPFLKDEKYHVTVTTHPLYPRGVVDNAVITFDRTGYWINVDVRPRVKHQTPMQIAMAKLTEVKGLEAALAVQAEVLGQVKDEAEQVARIWRVVVDALKAVMA